MNKYHVTYKPGAAYGSLPTEIEASDFRTHGRFIDFVKREHVGTTTLHRISADAIVHIELVEEGEESA